MVGEDNMRHSHATHDLYNAIDSGNFPTWNLNVQVSPGECCGFEFDFGMSRDVEIGVKVAEVEGTHEGWLLALFACVAAEEMSAFGNPPFDTLRYPCVG